MIVGAGRTQEIPYRLGDASCTPLFSGIRYCTEKLRVPSRDNSPYFPLNGETK